MDIEIGEVVTNVRASDGNSALSPKVMDQIVRTVLRAVREEREHEKRVDAERKVTTGVSHEQWDSDRR